MKEHVDAVTDGKNPLKKIGEVLKNIDKVAKSPEVKIVGALIGPDAQSGIEQGKSIIGSIAGSSVFKA